MDMADFRSFYTVALLIIFIGIWAWAWSRSNKPKFGDAANSLFDEKEEQMHAASLTTSGENKEQMENKHE